ncbi:transposable element Tcb2 transposase [Trichonephila clavipes]|nr:transposable element Tcb2 transposase [Trichonephila clavipes]
MAGNDRTASSRQLVASWCTATGVLMLASSIRRRLLHRGLRATVPLYRIPLTQYNARPHVAKTVRDFCSAQHIQLLPWPSYSSDMSSIEHVWDLVGRRLTRDPRPAAKDELLLRIQAIWNSLPQTDIQNLFDSMPRRIATLIAGRGSYAKY